MINLTDVLKCVYVNRFLGDENRTVGDYIKLKKKKTGPFSLGLKTRGSTSIGQFSPQAQKIVIYCTHN